MTGTTERRYNPLTGDWVLVSSGRQNRPWAGQVDAADQNPSVPAYAADCPLCPGNKRASHTVNADYKGPYAFDNDFPAFGGPSNPPARESADQLLRARSEAGRCRVVCFSEDHGRTLARMAPGSVGAVFRLYREETRLLVNDGFGHVQIFENRGEMMGCSNPHPHAQIWAQTTVPTIPATEIQRMRDYWRRHRSSLLLDYLEQELRHEDRIVLENDSFVALVPYWATWPFETLIVPRQPATQLLDLDDRTLAEFAAIVHCMTIRFDNLFRTDCPYSAGIHQHHAGGNDASAYQMHMHFYPPLLRSASIRKHMVGYEMLAEPQRDLSPEEAAQRLRTAGDVHFSTTDTA